MWRHGHGTAEARSWLAAWPIERAPDWAERVNQTDNENELDSLRQSVQRGRPFGEPEWQNQIAKRLGLESASRPSGRLPKIDRSHLNPIGDHHATWFTNACTASGGSGGFHTPGRGAVAGPGSPRINPAYRYRTCRAFPCPPISDLSRFPLRTCPAFPCCASLASKRAAAALSDACECHR